MTKRGRGWNLRAGCADGSAGRRAGGRVRAARENTAPRDWPCNHCETLGYTTKAQCWGHKGFRAVMVDNPGALSGLREKIATTGRADSRARWHRLNH